MDEELKSYLDRMQESIAGLRQEMAAEFANVRQEAADFRAETRGEFAKMRQEMTAEFANVRQEAADFRAETRGEFVKVRQHIDAVSAEYRHELDIAMTYMRRDVQLVAENFGELRSRIDRVETNLREEMRQGLAQTNSIIDYVARQHDRRITRLEQKA